MNRPKLVSLKEGIALGNPMHKGWVATFNWLLGFVANFAVGPGLDLLKRDTDTPELRLAIDAGEGISISWANDRCKISVASDGGDDDPGGSRGSGGGGSSGSGSGWFPGSESGQDSCNNWSSGVDNPTGDPGLDNPVDDCNMVNGW